MSAAITVRLRPADLRRVRASLEQYGKQARFALSLTINDVARGVRDAVRADLPRDLTIRTPQSATYLQRSVQAPRELGARKDRLTASVVLDRLNKRGMLPALAEGGTNEAGPWGPVAIPTKALRPTKGAVIPKGMYPRALGLLGTRAIDGGVVWARTANRSKKGRVRKGQKLGPHQGASGKWQVFGQARTFAIDPRFVRGNVSTGVYQRTGPGRDDIRKLWSYAPAVKVPNVVPYRKLADTVAKRDFAPLYARNLARALATAK